MRTLVLRLHMTEAIVSITHCSVALLAYVAESLTWQLTENNFSQIIRNIIPRYDSCHINNSFCTFILQYILTLYCIR
jgi:hypothetical protein